jgi:hypothetical protein
MAEFARVPMHQTNFACGCVSVEGVRDPKDCTEGHTAETVADGHEPLTDDEPKKSKKK